MEASQPFLMDIGELTPSQLYISEQKLARVGQWFHGSLSDIREPIPLKRLAGRVLMTDGHTRTVAAWRAGLRRIPCVWDADAMDWAAYAAYLSVCEEEGVTSVAQLAERLLPADEHARLWVGRCAAIERERFFRLLHEGEAPLFFARTPVPVSDCDVRAEEGGTRFRLFDGGVPVAEGRIERLCYAFWEIAGLTWREPAFGERLAAWLTREIVGQGKTALCRALPQDEARGRILEACGYRRLYE